MFISKKKLDQMIQNAKDETACKVMRDRDKEHYENDKAQKINEALKDIDRRLRRLESRNAEEKDGTV